MFVPISNRIDEHFRDKSTIHESHLQSSHNGTMRTILRSCYFLKRRAHLLQSYQYQTPKHTGGGSEHRASVASTCKL